MSFQAMTWATEQNLPCNQKMVLLMLANRTNNDTGRCDPSHKRLAEDCGLSQTALKSAINKLADAGYITVNRRKVGDINLPNQYTLCMKGVGREATEVGREAPEGVGREATTNLEYINHEVKLEIVTASPTAPPNECGASTVQPAPVKPKPRPREASQGTRLPTDWMLTQELGEWALSEGLTRDRIRQEADRFRDYWIAKPGAAGRKTDWPATWRNWVRRSTETKTGGNNGKAERISNFERVARDAERHIAELDRLDRLDAEMEQRNRAIGNGAVSSDCLAIPGESG